MVDKVTTGLLGSHGTRGSIRLRPEQVRLIEARDEERDRVKLFKELAAYGDGPTPELRRDIEAQRALAEENYKRRMQQSVTIPITQAVPQQVVPPIAVPQQAVPPIAVPQQATAEVITPNAAVVKGLVAGETIARDQEEASSISGLLGNFDWKKVIEILARPEFQQPGVSPLTAFTNATFAQGQAELAGAREQQKLNQSAEQTALENEYRRNKDARDTTRLDLAKQREARDRTKPPVITKAKLDAFKAQVGVDSAAQKIIDETDGNWWTRTFGNAPTTDTVATAIATEAITIQNANPTISSADAVSEAVRRIVAKAPAKSGGTPVKRKDSFAPK
tara:strand:+ start:8824 stop:9825 length:1002 start_codon:yes stop_codon:yes gene_type:complete